MPSFKLIWHTVVTKAMMYLKKAGTFILAASILIWFASNYPKHPEIEAQFNKKIEIAVSDDKKAELANKLSEKLLEDSYLGTIGKFSQPFFCTTWI